MPFREQHIRYFRTLDSIKTPSLLKITAWLLIGMVTITTAFLLFVPWVQTTSGPGIVTSLSPNDRLQDINALVSGRIQEWYVTDGSRVKAGDPIVQIVDNDPLLLKRLEAERQQVLVKLEAAKSAEATAKIDFYRMQDLYGEGLAARRDFEEAQIRLQGHKSRVAEVAAEINRIDVNLSRQSAQTVTAPRDGMILRVNSGDASTFISAGEVVATFVPENVSRAVELYIDGRDVALIKPGAKVRLQFEGWPVVQFSGWPSVAVGTFGGVVAAIDPSADNSGRFRIMVIEDSDEEIRWPDESYIRFGANARGWVLLETVTTGYELWRQLNNFPPKFPQTENTTP